MNTSQLLKSTVALLRASNTKKNVIAREVGVSRNWLYKLMADEIPDPGIHKIGDLYNYLTSQNETH